MTRSSPVQAEHGLEPLTDAGWAPALVGPDPVAMWRSTAERTDRLVKAVVDGPFTSGRPVSTVRATLEALADAGCAWIELHEPAATTIGDDADARARFADAHAALTDGFAGVHLSLAITGGDASAAGIETILAGAYASLALDLIDGPDGWYLVAKTPTTVGIICGALSTRAGSDDTIEVLALGRRLCRLDRRARCRAGRIGDRRIPRGPHLGAGRGQGRAARAGGDARRAPGRGAATADEPAGRGHAQRRAGSLRPAVGAPEPVSGRPAIR